MFLRASGKKIMAEIQDPWGFPKKITVGSKKFSLAEVVSLWDSNKESGIPSKMLPKRGSSKEKTSWNLP